MPKATTDELVLSFSRASLYMECPKKYDFKYNKRLPTTSSMALIFGTAIHEALEHNDNFFKVYRKSMPMAEIIAIFMLSLTVEADLMYKDPILKGERPAQKRIEIDKTEQLKSVDIGTWTEEQRKEYNDHLAMGRNLLIEYVADLELRAWYDPEESEKQFRITTNKFPVTFQGFIDFLSVGGHIVDRKTSKDPYKVKRIAGKPVRNPKTGHMIFDGPWEKRLQLIMYAIWFRKEHKKVEAGLMFDVLVKGTKPRLQVIDVIATEGEILQAIQVLHTVKVGIESEDFSPKPSFKCRWCDFRDACPSSKT